MTDLVLVDSTTSGADFTEILTWPRALESFVLLAAKNDRPVERLLSPRCLTNNLRPQMGSLEKLLIVAEHGNPTLSYLPTRDLKVFESLKFLGLPTYFLPICPIEYIPAHHVLPPNLECLQVEESVFGSHREVLWSGTVDEEALKKRARALSRFLQELAMLRHTSLPHLQSLRLWLAR